MPEKHTFVAHHIFDHYYNQLIKSEPNLQKIVDDKIRLAAENPLAGSPLQAAPNDLAGRIRKIWIRQNGRRLFYIHFPDQKVVLGIFITPVSRGDFDYSDFPWELFVEAKEDFDQKRLEKFRIVDVEKIVTEKKKRKRKKK